MPPPRVSFFTTGDITTWGSSHIVTNQCYVQYVAPRSGRVQRRAPLLFIHGGGLTGAQWESTPDRRPGWALLAAEEGRHVYIMDGVDSGRSQRAPDALREGAVEHRDARQMWQRFRFGPSDGWEERRPYEDSAFPVEFLDRLVSIQAARRRNTDALEQRGITDAIKELAVDGTVDIVAHSNGAALLLQAVQDLAHLVGKIVLVEPATTSKIEAFTKGFRPLVVWGDYIPENKVWRPVREAFDGSGAQSLVLRDVGIKGNSHFPMSDRNSNEVWEKISHFMSSK